MTIVAGIFVVMTASGARRRPAVKAATAGVGQRVVSSNAESAVRSAGRRNPVAWAGQKESRGLGRIERRVQADQPGEVDALGIARRRAVDAQEGVDQPERIGIGADRGSGRHRHLHRCTPPGSMGWSNDGRSPGSRLDASIRLPGPLAPSGSIGSRLAAYSCGGSAGLGPKARTGFPLKSTKDTVGRLAIMRMGRRQVSLQPWWNRLRRREFG